MILDTVKEKYNNLGRPENSDAENYPRMPVPQIKGLESPVNYLKKLIRFEAL